MWMIFRKIRHYCRLFQDAAHNGGLTYALARTWSFVRRRTALRLGRRTALRLGRGAGATFKPTGSPFADIVETLRFAPTTQPLLLIVSDTQIRQCIHYRIHQKIRYLAQLGIKAMHIAPSEVGRLRSFVPLAHTVIVYRTALDDEWISIFRQAGALVLYEFDDVVVGKSVVEESGILEQVTGIQAEGLLRQAEAFQATALACDGLIVSTPYLAELYGRPENGLADKPRMILPNFVETDDFAAPGKKGATFAFTSPSGSIHAELGMLTEFLRSYDRAADRDWSIIVMGNPVAQRHLSAARFSRGTILTRPFSDFDSYLAAVATAETVLIPLSDSGFNRAKTPIRLMDAAVAGSQAVFSPFGAYETIRDALHDQALCVAPSDWGQAGERLIPLLSHAETTTANFQQAVRQCFGIAAAKECYRALFVEELGLGEPIPTPLPRLEPRDDNASLRFAA